MCTNISDSGGNNIRSFIKFTASGRGHSIFKITELGITLVAMLFPVGQGSTRNG